MRTFLLIYACIVLATPSLLSAKPYKKVPSIPADFLLISKDATREIPGYGQANLKSSLQGTEYLLAEFSFDGVMGSCDPQGWISVDMIEQLGNFWHVDNFREIGGFKSFWCGAWPGPPLSHYLSLPGYGNGWNQIFESRVFTNIDDVTLEFDAWYDSEPNYDYTYIDYSPDEGASWSNLGSFDGDNSATGPDHITYVLPFDSIPYGVTFRFTFCSDVSYSDEDAIYASEDAFILDNIVVTDATAGILDTEDFEDESIGDHETTENPPDWWAYQQIPFGDFAGLYPGIGVVQEDPHITNNSCLWGFFNGSTEPYTCGPNPWPDQPSVPCGKECSNCYECKENVRYIHNAVWSPAISWNMGGSVPESAHRARLEFDVYADLPLENWIFYEWKVRSIIGGIPGPWQNNLWIYYDGGKGPHWRHVAVEVGDSIIPGAEEVQIMLAVWDLCWVWDPFHCSSVCHSHVPLFDNVKLIRYDPQGPTWNVAATGLFQDNFPADGSATGFVRVDRAGNVGVRPAIVPGDELLAEVSEKLYGLHIAPEDPDKKAVYIYVKCTDPAKSGATIIDDPVKWPLAASQDLPGWTKILMRPTGNPQKPDEFDVDLHDMLFTPPDRIDFFLAATDAIGRTTYWSEFTGTAHDINEAILNPMEMQCLPTGESDILYVDQCDGYGAQPYFDAAFARMGPAPGVPLPVDRFDVRAPSSNQGNGLGGRVANAGNQLVDVYRKILWNSGDLSQYTIGDGGADGGISPDVHVLYTFLHESGAWNPGLYLSGDDAAAELDSFDTALGFFDYIDYSLTTSNHTAAPYEYPRSPSILGSMPGTIFQHGSVPDQFYADGDCEYWICNDFDILEPGDSSAIQMFIMTRATRITVR